MITTSFPMSVDGRLEHVGEYNSGQKSNQCGEAYALYSRVLGNQHTADGSNQHHGTEQDGGLVILQLVAVGGNQTMHDEDAVVDADTEDEGGDDDTDEVELYIEDGHHT